MAYNSGYWEELERSLRKQLAEARAEIERLKGVVISQITPEPFTPSSYSTTAKPAKDERDELIEQMKKLLKAVECSEFEGPICFDVDGKNWFDAREAALSAAERGGK